MKVCDGDPKCIPHGGPGPVTNCYHFTFPQTCRFQDAAMGDLVGGRFQEAPRKHLGSRSFVPNVWRFAHYCLGV